ncbi:MAG TPA: RnfABCDGE type electron transport complex subunit B [Candidatus Saccharimonadia bacterium]|nr:RnfABCDGE type electron transport complex subunit B [Candidatus Saccharimonadia bacterium]
MQETLLLADAIDDLLPQTQCTQCGFAGCRPYAEAIARGEADIDRCPPGGASGVRDLARLLGRDAKPVDPTRGVTKPPQLVRIDESICIGCTKCIDACPVDAIVGASKRMHVVLVDECTGCELCIPPCPVDCIVIVPKPPVNALVARDAQRAAAARWRARHLARVARHARLQADRSAKLAALSSAAHGSVPEVDPVEAALARAAAKRGAGSA